MKTIKLKPTYYSKAKTITDVINCILHYPQQGVNNPQAFDYSIEFVEVNGSDTRPGTLLEYNQTGDYEKFILQMTDGEMTVYKQDDRFYFEVLTINELKQEKQYVTIVEDAFIDLMDGADPGDIQSMTGLQMYRVDEIFAVYKMVQEKRK